MFAIFKTGGKQYKVSPGDKIKIGKIAAKEDKEVKFSEVLLVDENKKTSIGQPKVKGAFVLAKVIKQGQGDKVIVFKYKSKKRYKKKQGFRAKFTELEILKINS